ncbi:MAG: hypothetical protein H7317_19300 [Pseudorhodobacter sp.]|nr:hypothetical protein [Pseudorhodobacter sp.]
MTLFRLIPYAEDIAWHATGIAQGLFDVATVVVLALAVYASDVGVQPVATAQSATVIPTPVVCLANCITAQVLKRQDS